MAPRRGPRDRTKNPISPKVLRVARSVSRALADRGYRHVLIGGLAVNAHGYERTTGDVDFLVTSEAEYDLAGDSLGGEARGKTINRDGVAVDLLFPRTGEEFLERDIASAYATAKGKQPLVPGETLVYLKLSAGRMRDTADVVELLKRGRLNVAKVRAYLKKNAAELVDDFGSLVEQAKLESD